MRLMLSFLRNLILKIETVLADSIEKAYTSLSEISGSLFLLLLSIWFFVMGINYLAGIAKSLNSWLRDIAIFIVCFTAAKTYAFIAKPLYLLAIGLPDDVVKAIGNSDVPAAIASILSVATSFSNNVVEQWPGLNGLGWIVHAMIIYVPLMILLAVTFIYFLIAKFLITFIVALLPFLFVFLAFPATRQYFNNSLGSVVNYVFLSIMAILMLSFTKIIFIGLSQVLLMNIGTDEVVLLTLLMSFLIIALLVVTSQLPLLAASIGGGFAAATGASVQGVRAWAARARRGITNRADGSSRITRRKDGSNRVTTNQKGELVGSSTLNKAKDRVLTTLSKARNKS